MKTLRLTLLLTVFGLLAGLAVPAQEEKKESPEAAAKTTEKARPTLKLLESGTEPRQQLRFDFVKGQKQTVQVKTKMNMSMKIGEFPLPSQPLPSQVMTMDLAINKVSEAGTATIDFQVTSSGLTDTDDIPDFQLRQMEKLLGGMEGLKGTSIIDKKGYTESVDFQIAEGTDKQVAQQIESLKSSLQQMANPFPDEAVGPGARWEVRMPFEQNGIKIVQVTSYLLKSYADGKGNLEVKVKQMADEQNIHPPGAPPGSDIKLTEFDGSGSGQINFSVKKAGPLKSTISSKTALKTEAAFGDQVQKMSIEVSLDISLVDGVKAPEPAQEGTEKSAETEKKAGE